MVLLKEACQFRKRVSGMTGIKTGTGGTVAGREVFRSAMPVKSAKPEKTVRVKGEQISVKADRQETILDQYRVQGVELELSGDQPESIYTEEDLEKMRADAEMKNLQEMYQENLEAAKEAAEAAGEGFEDLGRALEIARRMMHGDIVPASDEKFLMDFNRDIYMGAKNMQALAKNDDPEKYDSILEDEEGEGAGVTADGPDITVDATGLNLCQPNMG